MRVDRDKKLPCGCIVTRAELGFMFEVRCDEHRLIAKRWTNLGLMNGAKEVARGANQ